MIAITHIGPMGIQRRGRQRMFLPHKIKVTAVHATHQKKDRGSFFLFFTIVLLGIVLVGFAPSFFLRLLVSDAPLPFYLHIHGALLTAWFLLLLAQATLIRNGSRALHQRLGQFFAIYGVAVAVGSLMATFNYVSRELASGITFESDMADVNPLQASGLPFLEFATALVWFNMASVMGFAILLALAMVFRARADDHKRYIVLASLSIIAPGLARISRLVLQTEQSPIIPVGLLVLALAVVANDFLTERRLHRATLIAGIILVVLNGMAGVMALSSHGEALVRLLA